LFKQDVTHKRRKSSKTGTVQTESEMERSKIFSLFEM